MSAATVPAAVTRIVLSPRTAQLLGRGVRGRGGYQQLLRRLQRGLDGLSLDVAVDDLQALERSASMAGSGRPGGFQLRIRALLGDRLGAGEAQQQLPFVDALEAGATSPAGSGAAQ